MLQGAYLPVISETHLSTTLGSWRASSATAGVLALVPEAEKEHIGLLQAVALGHDLPLMGAIFPALLTSNGFRKSGITLLRVDPCPPWFLVDHLPDPQDTSGILRLTDYIDTQLNDQLAADIPTLFLIFDGLLPNIGTLLHRTYENLGHRVRYAGVNAGSETFQSMPCLFDHERLIKDGCIGLLFPATHRFIVEHRYPISRALFRATSTSGNRIDQIDGKPAMSVYQELLKSEFGVEITPENFYQYAVHYPFGLVTAIDVLVRIPVGLTDHGAIHCVGEIPPNAILRLLRAPKLEESQCIGDIVSKLNNPDAPLVAFYCAGRHMHFGDDAGVELRQLITSSNSPDIFGALSLGEIGTDAEMGLPEFHNAALVCVR